MDGLYLKRLIESKKLNKTKLAATLGMSKQNLYQLFETKEFQPETLKTIENYFKLKWPKAKASINIDVPRETNGYIDRRRQIKNTSDRKHAVPYYDAEATGSLTETEMTAIHAPAGTIDVGDLLRDSQAAIRIYGNSMLPSYPPGCVVALLKIDSHTIEPGEVYVVETRDRRLLKRLFYPNDKPSSDLITCYSDNTMKFDGGARHGKLAYPPFDIPKKEIISLFVVTGVIKRNANSIIMNR